MKRVLQNSSFIIILLLLLHVSSRILIPKWLDTSDNMISLIVEGFYAEKNNSLDVMFMGNSDVYRGISPIELWDNYGIKAYAYTSPGQRMWTAYYLLEDTLRSQKPQIIFLNVDAAFFASDSGDGNYHKAYDNMQLSLAKIKAITNPDLGVNVGTRISYLFPVLRYHSRYNELSALDFKHAFSNNRFPYKGLDMNFDIVPNTKYLNYMDNNEKIEIPSKPKKYLDKIVNLCKKENIELILFEIPSADSWNMAKSETMSKYANEASLKFIDLNLTLDEMNFDWSTDSSDGGDHLNVYGAIKVTNYLGEYLNNNYDLKDYRNDKKFNYWNNDSKKYHEDIKSGSK